MNITERINPTILAFRAAMGDPVAKPDEVDAGRWQGMLKAAKRVLTRTTPEQRAAFKKTTGEQEGLDAIYNLQRASERVPDSFEGSDEEPLSQADIEKLLRQSAEPESPEPTQDDSAEILRRWMAKPNAKTTDDVTTAHTYDPGIQQAPPRAKVDIPNTVATTDTGKRSLKNPWDSEPITFDTSGFYGSPDRAQGPGPWEPLRQSVHWSLPDPKASTAPPPPPSEPPRQAPSRPQEPQHGRRSLYNMLIKPAWWDRFIGREY